MAVKKTKVKKRALKQAVTDGFANLLGSLKSMIGHRAAATRTACKTVGVTLTNPSRCVVDLMHVRREGPEIVRSPKH